MEISVRHLLIIVAALVLVCSAPSAEAKIHSVDIEVRVTSPHGDVGAHFSRYYEGRTSGSCFTRIESRDDESHHHITPKDPWLVHDRHVIGRGTYILDLCDWQDDPSASVLLKIDGIIRFQASGNDSNYNRWTKAPLGPNTRITDDREIAVDLPD